MYRIIDKRGSGKTSRLMLLAKETGATVVSENPSAMEAKAKAYGITGLKFTSYSSFIEGNTESKETFMVDELDSFLSAIGITGYTITTGDD